MKTYLKFTFALVLSTFYCFPSSALHPTNNILDNSDITWAAEVYTDYTPNVNYFALGRKKMQKQYGISRSTFSTLKIQQASSDHINLDDLTLARKILNMSNNSSSLFKDASLSTPLSYADYLKITQETTYDTTFVSQPEGTKTMQIIANKININEIQLFRVKQILHYNEKTNELGLTPIAIAPILSSYDKEGKLISTTPLFWMSVQAIAEQLDLNAATINWAKRLTRSIDTDEVTVIKGNHSFATILNKILYRYTQTPNTSKLYHTYGKMTPMSPQEIKKLNSGLDTLITFDPVTFEEKVSVINNTPTPETMHTIRIVQDWIWNEDTQNISIRLVAFAPLLKRYDNHKNFLHSGPMFYKKPNE